MKNIAEEPIEDIHSENCECCGNFLRMEEKCDELKKHIKMLVWVAKGYKNCGKSDVNITKPEADKLFADALASLPEELRGL